MRMRYILPVIAAILVGVIFSEFLFKSYGLIENEGNIYYIQYGVYVTSDTLNESVASLSDYIIEEIDEKYYVYLGITGSYETAEKIKNMYDEVSTYTYIRSSYITDYKFINVLKEYDKRLNKETKPEELKKIMQKVFDHYKNLNK